MGDFVIRRWDLAPYPGDQAPPHVHHGSDEAFCVIEGALEVRLGEQRVRLGPGDYVQVPAGTVHTFATVGDEPVRVLAVMSPEVDALIEALHSAVDDEQRAAAWARHNSALA